MVFVEVKTIQNFRFCKDAARKTQICENEQKQKTKFKKVYQKIAF